MAECLGNIVYRKDVNDCSAAVADDNCALVKAYEGAVKSFPDGQTSEGEESVDGMNEKTDSGEQSEGPEKEGTATWHHWAVGSRCRAVWSEDGLLYPAALVSVEGERGRVAFDGYGNEEDVELNALLPEHLDQPRREKQQWVLGSRCRAVWSEDGLVYPAVLIWKKGDRGRVQFESYGNEEELNLSALLPPEDHRNRIERVNSAKDLKTGPASSRNNSSNTDWRKKDKENTTKKQDSAIILPPACTAGGVRDGPSLRSGPGTEQKDQRKSGCCREGQMGAWPPSAPPSNFLPPFPPRIPADILSSTPPPLPPLAGVWPPWTESREAYEALDSDVSALSSMLLSWYLCGYHTGSYMATQQAKAGSESSDKETRKPSSTYGMYKD